MGLTATDLQAAIAIAIAAIPPGETTAGPATPSLFTPGSVIFAGASTLAEDNPGLFYDLVNHRLGVGTATPGYRLHVWDTNASGRALAAVQTGTTGNNVGGSIEAAGFGATQNIGLLIGADNATTNYALYIAYPAAAANKWALYSPATAQSYFAGNVGIGTTAPKAGLHINNVGTLINGTAADRGYLIIGPSADVQVEFDNNSIQAMNNTTPSNLYINYNGGSTIINGGVGKVGIGTVAPAARCHIQGIGAASTDFIVTSSDYINGSMGSQLQIGAFGGPGNVPSFIDASMVGGTVAGSLILQSSGGNCGIGVNPLHRLDVSQSGFVRGRIVDYGGQFHNVMAYGAVGDGTTDDTSAINSAIAGATAAGGTVLFPAGFQFKTTGNHTLTTCSVAGGGSGHSVIKLEHATNDLFFIDSSAGRDDIGISGLTVTSSTVRTAGWVIRYAPTYNAGFVLRRARIKDVVMLGQFNGIWIGGYEYCWLNDLLYDYPSSTGTTGGIAFKLGQTAATNVNQGSEIYLNNCQANNRSASSNALSYGFWMEDCDAVYLKTCGAIASRNPFTVTNTGHQSANYFWDQVVADGTTNVNTNDHACWIKGSAGNVRFTITNSWFSSAGQGVGGGGGPAACDGLHIDVGADFVISNSFFYNNGGYGMYCTDVFQNVAGCSFSGNGTAGLYVNGTSNANLQGLYTGNSFYNATHGWVTSATSNRTGFIGNYYSNAPLYNGSTCTTANNVTY